MNSERHNVVPPSGGRVSSRARPFLQYLIPMIWLWLPAAHADPWRNEDTWRELAFQAVYVYDLQQNLVGLRDWQHHDKRTLSPSVANNAFLGPDSDEEAISAYFIVTGLLHWTVSAMLPAEAREHWQWLSIGYVTSDLASNFRLGMRLTF